ncbi:VPLPA-CTERM-specific exosortase XrtD [Roseovarius sp. ZX-A-9]|uniref:VPLPA-CTERM-specific exosortase XrtD n=1 Tax=Roseovarius sp. ZX-A-9 TaxID=3014783 RepID=UPI00232D4EC7|nr:VPLPA-CTERM-specific exosortase XrtD [Roseovarius sp. ZX-A-9]
MTVVSRQDYLSRATGGRLSWGLVWLVVIVLAAAVFFSAGFDVLFDAWSRPEYSHGPLIPVLSGLMFLRELKQYPPQPGPKSDRWQGLLVVLLAITIAVSGVLLHADSLVAYAMIIWVGGILLISFGWRTGKHFWPPVLHLVFMLPLPGMVYYEISTLLQLISSELGVWFLRLAGVPVFLDGNIIDLGVLKLHVAEACSGLRYLFPILSFSYIFAFLYQGPTWHKLLLLVAAAPIAVFMNSVRIAMAGILMQRFGPEWLEGFTHFFEGWVIFMASVFILICLAWILLKLNPRKMSLAEALDLDTQGVFPQLARLKLVQPSVALMTAAVLMIAAAGAWPLIPERTPVAPERFSFTLFPSQVGEWRQVGEEQKFSPDVERSLAADDYIALQFGRAPGTPTLDFFSAWYKDLSADGVQHTPEICLPGAGWEIAEVERVDISGDLGLETPFNINRIIVQKNEERMIVYYWFTHMGKTMPRNTSAKISVLTRGLMAGRTDGAILRLISPIKKGQPNAEAEAEAEMNGLLKELLPRLPRFIPGI